ncbi:MAG: hypothetical protein JXA73_10960 [Acidobacteria bacterium]|nr:hypothetical protein [Acidobacteriota bacterium]
MSLVPEDYMDIFIGRNRQAVRELARNVFGTLDEIQTTTTVYEDVIQSLIAGNPQFHQLEELVEHCKTCPECRDLFEMHRTLADFGSRFDEMEAVDLTDARRSIVQKVESQNRRRPRSSLSSLRSASSHPGSAAGRPIPQ